MAGWVVEVKKSLCSLFGLAYPQRMTGDFSDGSDLGKSRFGELPAWQDRFFWHSRVWTPLLSVLLDASGVHPILGLLSILLQKRHLSVFENAVPRGFFISNVLNFGCSLFY